MNEKKLIRFDWFIKKMLRDKSDYKVLEGFLTALLKRDIEVISILESEGNQSTEDNKFNRVDILVEVDKKEKIIIEIQNDRESDYLERVLYGTSKVVVDYIKLGKDFKDVSKVISVSILYFNLGSGDDYIYHGITEFRGVHTKSKLKVKSKAFIIDNKGYEKLTFKEKDNIFPEYYIINVEKFTKVIKEDIDEWIYMLKTSELKKEFKSKYIDIAREKLNYEDLNDEEKRNYENHIINVVRERDIMETAKNEGREEGREEERIGIAKNLLDVLDDITISNKTGLSVDEVKGLR
ncbi:MAG: Rpn family recombination-promoting nuclease/putative transposase [Clostridium sp.]